MKNAAREGGQAQCPATTAGYAEASTDEQARENARVAGVNQTNFESVSDGASEFLRLSSSRPESSSAQEAISDTSPSPTKFKLVSADAA